jgi:4-amino-4-deoxy-L-arabinose transferase-like glycosyltransferase
MAQSDPWLKQLPIAVGAVAGILLLTNRFLTSDLTVNQSRSDALGIIVSAVLILTGLLWQQAQPRDPEVVVLEGEEGFDLALDLPEAVAAELAWASRLLLTNTASRSVLVYYQDRVILRRGILGPSAQLVPGPIVKRVMETGKAVYLVALKLYPGRIEFDYLPPNTQGVICQPLGRSGVLVLGANAPRSYTQQDEVWLAGIAEKLNYTLNAGISPE